MKANVGAIVQFTLTAPGSYEWVVTKPNGGNVFIPRDKFLGHIGEVTTPDGAIWIPVMNVNIQGVLYSEHVTIIKP